MNTHRLVAIVAVCLVGAPSAQGLLRDINPTRSNSNGSLLPVGGVVHQGVYYFAGGRWDTGRELWRSDGTVAGTFLVRDLALGTANSNPQYFVRNGSLLFFVAAGRPWRSDGSPSGTYPIGPYTSSFSDTPTLSGSHVVWVTSPGLTDDLWSSDGNATTPTLLMSGSLLREVVTSGNHAYFTFYDAMNGMELWRTDGTPAGTTVLDIVPGAGHVDPSHLCDDGAGGVWFSGTTQAAGTELWHSDGTVAGTAMVADLRPGSQSSYPQKMCALGSRVFFAAEPNLGQELYVSDGTAVGTRLVLDIAPGTGHSSPEGLVAVPALGRVFFSATDPTAGREPWTSDGTSAGTYRLLDVQPGNGSSSFSGLDLYWGLSAGVLYFTAYNTTIGTELYRTDGTQAGTGLVANLVAGMESSGAKFLADLSGAALFSVHSLTVGTELWRLAAPATVPSLLGDFHPAPTQGSFVIYNPPAPAQVATLDGRQHFAAFDPAAGLEPFAHGGTAASTTLVAQLFAGTAGNAQLVAATSTHVYYDSRDASSWSIARLVAVPVAGAPVVIATDVVVGCAALRESLVFSVAATNSEPMITDGTVAGTRLLAEVRPGPASSTATNFTTFRERVYFSADDGVAGRELWSTDGTTAGTTLTVDVTPGTAGSNPSRLVAGRSLLYFQAAGVMWCTDGSAVGTHSLSSMPLTSGKAILGDVLIGTTGLEVWRTDGTNAGTYRLALSDALSGGAIDGLCVARNLAFFTMNRLSNASELWVTDGTVAGTHVVVVLQAMQGSYAPPIAPAGWGHVACARTTELEGSELWISDGTTTGTVLVVDLEPGPAPTNPVFAMGDTTAGRMFTWWPDTLAFGYEPWALPLATFGGSDFDRYGVGCPGSRGVPTITGDGAPILGSQRLAFVLEHAIGNSFSYLVLGFSRVPGPAPCVLRNSAEVLVGLFTNAQGYAEHAFAVPSAAALMSVAISGQFVVLDPQGAALGLASATAGLEAFLGR